jgi:muramidase (phage lysozyme)
LRRRLFPLPVSRPTSTTAAHPCAVALLLVLPLAGQLPRPDPLPGRAAATELASTQAIKRNPDPYPLTPERRALLNTIRYAEGTWLQGSQDGYRMIYGGSLFHGFHRHPEIVVEGNYVSAAAGAYQFLPTTWRAAAQELNLPDFSPPSQDQAALHLVHRRGALRQFDREGLSAEVLARLAPEWASLPSHHGGSVYGQPVHSADSLRAFYQRDLERQRRIASSTRGPAAPARLTPTTAGAA